MGALNKKNIPKAVVEQIVQDLAKADTKDRDFIQKIADKWDVSNQVVDYYSRTQRRDIAAMRHAIAERNLLMAGHIQERMTEKLNSDEAMAETPFRDLGMILEKNINGAVTAMEGHAPTIGKINWTEIRAEKVEVMQYRERIEEMKRKAVIDVTPA